jgi:hypothetical protein
MKITDKMVKVAHKALHITWWQLPPGGACTPVCGEAEARVIELESQLISANRVIDAVVEFRDNGGIQHVWNCDSGVPGVGERPCDCGVKVLQDALADEPKEAGIPCPSCQRGDPCADNPKKEAGKGN